MAFEIFALVALLAFVLEFFDASVGMGYGIMTPALLLMGFPPLETILAVLFTSAVLSLLAGVLHHGYKNVDFSFDSRSFRITEVLVAFGALAVLAGVLIAVSIPADMLKLYIGAVVLTIGLLILTRPKMRYVFSWKRLIALGAVASFNKGMTGGGFGPVLAGGQVLAGVESKKAVAITAMVEGVVCSVGIGAYVLFNGFGSLNAPLILSMLLGGAVSTYLAVHLVKRIDPHKLRCVIGIASLAFGLLLITRVL